jgi:hypothetical protein
LLAFEPDAGEDCGMHKACLSGALALSLVGHVAFKAAGSDDEIVTSRLVVRPSDDGPQLVVGRLEKGFGIQITGPQESSRIRILCEQSAAGMELSVGDRSVTIAQGREGRIRLQSGEDRAEIWAAEETSGVTVEHGEDARIGFARNQENHLFGIRYRLGRMEVGLEEDGYSGLLQWQDKSLSFSGDRDAMLRGRTKDGQQGWTYGW